MDDITTVSITIDGKQARVNPGTSILWAANSIGISIPTLCFDPLLEPEGMCRLCCVELEGVHGLLSACSTPVSDGMVIHTATETVLSNRRLILDMVLSKFGAIGPEDPAYNAYYKLRQMADQAGLGAASFVTPAQQPHYLTQHDPVLAISPERCIQCNRCFRYCEHLHGFHPSEIIDMGGARQLSFALGIPLSAGQCDHCGNCVEHCPTGALLEQWQVTNGPAERESRSICTYCGTGCSLELQIKDNKVIGARPDVESFTVNKGELCVKGRFGFDFASHPDRITRPLVRERQGHSRDCFRETGWDEALALVAEGFKDIRDHDGGDKLAVLSSARASNEENYLAQKLARAVFGTNNVDNCARICHAPSVVGLTAAFGSGAATNSLDEIPGADCILVVGANPTEAHPVIGHKIKDAVLHHGAHLVVADPRQIWLTEIADVHLPLIPGTNAALLNGLLRAMLEEDLINHTFIEERTEQFDELNRFIMDNYSLERVQEITGVVPERIRQAARLYARAENGMIIYGLGITQHTHGSTNVMALANLALACGHIGKPHTGVNPLRGQNNVQGACDVGALPNVLPGYQKLDDMAVVDKFTQHWQVEMPIDDGLKSCQMIRGAHNNRVRGMYIIAEDPIQTDPDSHFVEKALGNLDFLVVQELFFTRTAAYADAILPAACSFEKEGTFINSDRRVQHFAAAVPAPGECRPDWQIICAIAERMGYPMNYDGPAAIWDELADLTPVFNGVRYSRLLAGESLVWPCRSQEETGERFLHSGTFARGKGRFHTVHYEPPMESPDKEFPYLLTTGRRLEHYCNGSMTRKSEGLRDLYPEELLEINPRDARALELSDGDRVEVINHRGQLQARCHVTERSPEGTVFMSFHFAETPVNVLTGSYFDPLAITPEYKVSTVNIRKLS